MLIGNSIKKEVINNHIRTLEGYTYGKLHSLIENPAKNSTETFKNILGQIAQINIENIRRKVNRGDKIKVAFIPSRVELWSCDRLYRLLYKDDRFDPYIILTRTELYDGDDNDELTDTYNSFRNFFNSKGFKCMEGYDEAANSYKTLDKLFYPDIIIHLMPHIERVPREYWIMNMPLSVLNIYIPYGIMSANYQQAQFNLTFHHLCWKIFCETPVHRELAEKYSDIGSFNVCCSGYIKMDTFFESALGTDINSIWKTAEGNDLKDVKKIIWAPHHWFGDNDEEVSFATFEKNNMFMYDYARSHSDTSWILKPHPLLKTNGIRAGVFKSGSEYDDYMRKWDNLPNAKVVEKDVYFDIFKTSDAMILDSVSFLSEYLYVNKPMLRLTKPLKCNPFNEFGDIIRSALYDVPGDDFDGIADFICNIVGENDYLKGKREEIFDKYLNYPKRNNGLLASDYVYEYLKDIFQL